MKKLILALSLAGLSQFASAASVDDLWSKELGAVQSADVVSSSDTKLMRIWYVGSATEAYVSVGLTTMLSSAPAGTRDTANFGSQGVITFSVSTSNTLGEVCASIDARADYECELLAGRSNQDARLLRTKSATAPDDDLKQGGGFEVKADTDSAITNSLTNSVWITTSVALGIIPSEGKYIRLQECRVNANGGIGGTVPRLRVYGRLRRFEQAESLNLETSKGDGRDRGDTTIAWDQILAANTTLTKTWSIDGKGGLDFATNERVVVDAAAVVEDASLPQAFANFLECQWEER